jgi:tetratricopeptide (TPR) repeat protein
LLQLQGPTANASRPPSLPELEGKGEPLAAALRQAHEQALAVLATEQGGPNYGMACGRLGAIYHANFEADRAIRCYQLASLHDPAEARWPYLQALVLQDKGENRSVLQPLKAALKLAPDYAPGWLKLADLLFKQRLREESAAAYRRYLDLRPADPYGFLGLARIAKGRGDWRAAQRLLERSLAAEPDFANTHRMLAEVHRHLGQHEQARASLAAAAKLSAFSPAPDPWLDEVLEECREAETLLVLGARSVRALDFRAAHGYFLRAAELAPANPAVHLALGKMMFMLGRNRQAHQSLARAVELDPQSTEGLFQLALVEQRRGNVRQAVALLLRAVKLNPDNPRIYNNLGVIYLSSDAQAKALDSFRRALEIDPEFVNAMYNTAAALWGLDRPGEALAWFQKVLRLKPDMARAADALAWLSATSPQADLRDGERAVRWASVACRQTERRNPSYLDTLAAAYAELGDYPRAREIAAEAKSLAETQGKTKLAEDIEHRRRLYTGGAAYRE